jgi:hypothetical protein
MSELNRRAFSKETLGSLLTFSLLETLLAGDLVADEIKPITSAWMAEVNEMSGDLKDKKISQVQWQAKVEELFQHVDVAEFLTYIDFDNLTKDLKFRPRGERALRARFPEVEGLPTQFVFGHQIFALQKDRSVVPHGHNNMATSFLVLKGDFHGRHYDRLEDLEEHFIIKPTIDRAFKPGEYSTVSDDKDNIHWFKASSDAGFIFNIHVLNVDPAVKKGGRVYLDPDGEKISEGRIRARRLKASEAYDLYG